MPEDSELLINLEDVVDCIMRRQLLSTMENPPAAICRYDTFDTFRKMTEHAFDDSGKRSSHAILQDWAGLDLWLMDVETMNDPLEGLFLSERSRHWNIQDSKNPKALMSELFKEDLESDYINEFDAGPIFISSFSSKPDDLDLWRLYCNGHGVCLKFSPPSHKTFYRVEYGDKAVDSTLDELAWVIEPILARKSPSLLNSRARTLVRPLCFLFKSEGHKTDEEFRLIESHQDWKDVQMTNAAPDGKNINRLYIRHRQFFFSSHGVHDEVIVGPLASSPLEATRGHGAYIKEVKWRLNKLGLGRIPVKRSRHILRH